MDTLGPCVPPTVNYTVCNLANYPEYCVYNPFGPKADCTLDVCCPEYSVYAYIPSLAGNATFLATFAVAMLVHVLIGLVWNQWWFMCCMVAGCLDEVLGYAGRLWMNQDLWNYNAFMIQVGELINLHEGLRKSLTCTSNSLRHHCSRLLLRCHLRPTRENASDHFPRLLESGLTWFYSQ